MGLEGSCKWARRGPANIFAGLLLFHLGGPSLSVRGASLTVWGPLLPVWGPHLSIRGPFCPFGAPLSPLFPNYGGDWGGALGEFVGWGLGVFLNGCFGSRFRKLKEKHRQNFDSEKLGHKKTANKLAHTASVTSASFASLLRRFIFWCSFGISLFTQECKPYFQAHAEGLTFRVKYLVFMDDIFLGEFLVINFF